MLTIAKRCVPFLAAGALLIGCDDEGPNPDRYQATLAGSSEVPPNDSDASGSIVITDFGGEMEYRLDVTNLDFPTMAHIHAGAEGENGGIIVPLFSTQNPVASFSGRLATDSFVEADIQPLPGATVAMSMDSLRVLMRNGKAYVNVHTVALPGGEIRGQIGPR